MIASRKVKNQIILFADNMIIYLNDPKDFTNISMLGKKSGKHSNSKQSHKIPKSKPNQGGKRSLQ
jgi:hypothetical protein